MYVAVVCLSCFGTMSKYSLSFERRLVVTLQIEWAFYTVSTVVREIRAWGKVKSNQSGHSSCSCTAKDA